METKNAKPAKKKKYVKRNKAYWGAFKKKKAAKKKAAKHNHESFFHRPEKDLPKLKTRAQEVGQVLNVVLYALDLLTVSEKAEVFSRILGTDQVSEEQMWAVTKILKP